MSGEEPQSGLRNPAAAVRGVGAAALALALYELGHLINKTIEAFVD